MPRSVSPPISPKTLRQPKRPRQSSKSEPSVEELGQDDLGYDADVEVVLPDQYEEPESDFEDTRPSKAITAIDEEITRGMRQLGWRHDRAALATGPVTEHFSDLESSAINQYGKRTEFHVSTPSRTDGRRTLVPPAKRRKRRETHLNVAQQIIKSISAPQTDSSDRTEGKRTPFAESSTSTGSTMASEEPQVGSNDEMQLD